MSRSLVGFIDLDGTMVDLVGGLARAHGKPLDRHTWPATYDLSVAMGMPMSAVWEHECVVGAAFWEGLDKLPRAGDLVRLVQRYCPDVAFLSQGVRDPASFHGKVAWAKRHYPKVPVLVGTQKTLVSRPGHVLIDDYEKNMEEWTARGGSFVLIPGPWNGLRGTPDEHILPLVERKLEEIKGYGV